MAQELVYTSVPRGLRLGSSGFSTVACTRGMAPNYVELLESLSGYTPIFAPHDANAGLNPAVHSHLRTKLGGKLVSILSRVAFAGMDYSKRSNKFAHHIVLSPEERPEGGPAWLQSQPGVMLQSWSGEPRHIEAPRRIPQGNGQDAPCGVWQRATGDAGWAGVLAQYTLDSTRTPAFIVFQPGTDMLALVREALQLLPPEKRWAVTYSTYYTTMPAGLFCNWRCIVAGSPALAEVRQSPGALVLDVSGQAQSPEAQRRLAQNAPLIALARTGLRPRPVAVRVASSDEAPLEIDDAPIPVESRGERHGAKLERWTDLESDAPPTDGQRKGLRASHAKRRFPVGWFVFACVLLVLAFASAIAALVFWRKSVGIREEAPATAGNTDQGQPASGGSETSAANGNENPAGAQEKSAPDGTTQGKRGGPGENPTPGPATKAGADAGSKRVGQPQTNSTEPDSGKQQPEAADTHPRSEGEQEGAGASDGTAAADAREQGQQAPSPEQPATAPPKPIAWSDMHPTAFTLLEDAQQSTPGNLWRGQSWDIRLPQEAIERLSKGKWRILDVGAWGNSPQPGREWRTSYVFDRVNPLKPGDQSKIVISVQNSGRALRFATHVKGDPTTPASLPWAQRNDIFSPELPEKKSPNVAARLQWVLVGDGDNRPLLFFVGTYTAELSVTTADLGTFQGKTKRPLPDVLLACVPKELTWEEVSDNYGRALSFRARLTTGGFYELEGNFRGKSSQALKAFREVTKREGELGALLNPPKQDRERKPQPRQGKELQEDRYPTEAEIQQAKDRVKDAKDRFEKMGTSEAILRADIKKLRTPLVYPAEMPLIRFAIGDL